MIDGEFLGLICYTYSSNVPANSPSENMIFCDCFFVRMSDRKGIHASTQPEVMNEYSHCVRSTCV